MKTQESKYEKNALKQPSTWLAILTFIVLIIPNIMLCHTEHLSFWASLANILIPGGIYAFLLGSFRNVGRTVLFMFPLMFFGAFQIVLLGLYGRSVIAVDMFLNVVTTNSNEVGELLGNLAGIILFVCLLYLPPTIWAIFMVAKGKKLERPVMSTGKVSGLSMACVGVLTAAAASITGEYSLKNDLFPANALHNMSMAIDREAKIKKYEVTSRDFTYDAKSVRNDSTKQLVVLVIGETSRAGSWQLAGYERPTNPQLSKRIQNIVMFDHAMSESNTTHKSVPLMLSPLDSKDYEARIYSIKGIISAFKDAGFATAYVSNQERNHGFIDFFGEEADTCLFIKDHPDIFPSDANDLVMNEPLAEIIDNAADKQLIVVHTYGSHFNYRSRYDDEFRKFVPDNAETPEPSNRQQLVNAYDNTILVTDAFLDRLIASMETQDSESVLLYAADHGEDIFDDQRGLFLHASPCPSYYQLHVPMMAWISPEFEKAHPQKVAQMRRHRHESVSTSASYFHTALDLAGINTKYYDGSLSVASGDFKERPLAYLDDHNEKVDLTTAGFGPMDYRVMAKQHMTASVIEKNKK